MFRCASNRYSRRPLILTTHPIVVFGSSAAAVVTFTVISNPEAAASSGSGVFLSAMGRPN
jgi:surfactin synthase thioesterase subunit